MALASKIVLAVATLGTSCILYDMAKADDVPDALSVEWQGKKPCEKLFDDENVRVVRCTFAPGAVHVCHSHPGYLTLQLPFPQVSESMGNHDSKIVDAGSVN